MKTVTNGKKPLCLIRNWKGKTMVNLHPTVCNLCGGPVGYISNSVIYGREYGSGYCYLCQACGAFVGTHKGRPREAFGVLANARMRKGKVMCHEIFDSKWRGKPKAHKKRNDLYEWLAEKLEIPVEECHFGYFNLDMLLKAYKILLDIKDVPLKYDARGNIIN